VCRDEPSLEFLTRKHDERAFGKLPRRPTLDVLAQWSERLWSGVFIIRRRQPQFLELANARIDLNHQEVVDEQAQRGTRGLEKRPNALPTRRMSRVPRGLELVEVRMEQDTLVRAQ
jgi:hypothetical protein